jgi:hypothetical protein
VTIHVSEEQEERCDDWDDVKFILIVPEVAECPGCDAEVEQHRKETSQHLEGSWVHIRAFDDEVFCCP